MENKTLVNVIRWAVIVAVPFLLTMGSVRLLIAWNSPSYPEFEYGRIAPDRFGFTEEERLDLAEQTLAYLRRPESAQNAIHLLEEMTLPGTNEPVYNPSEIEHMIDVKVVADAFRSVSWILAVIALGGLAFLFARPTTRLLGANTLMRSGIVTVSIVVLVMLLIGVAWSFVFTTFHNILFDPGTWTFAYSDSLIRLFPEQFWFDFGVIWTSVILISGALLAGIGYALQRAWTS